MIAGTEKPRRRHRDVGPQRPRRLHAPRPPRAHQEGHDRLLCGCETKTPSSATKKFRGSWGECCSRGEERMKPTDTLSGGETVRSLLSQLMMRKDNVLILDEPTNHLDLESIAALAEGFERYEGTAIVVTHDQSSSKLSRDAHLGAAHRPTRHRLRGRVRRLLGQTRRRRRATPLTELRWFRDRAGARFRAPGRTSFRPWCGESRALRTTPETRRSGSPTTARLGFGRARETGRSRRA